MTRERPWWLSALVQSETPPPALPVPARPVRGFAYNLCETCDVRSAEPECWVCGEPFKP